MKESLFTFLATTESIITDSANRACGNGANCGGSIDNIFKGVTSALIFIIGAVSVIMIIVGGLRYVTSNGDAKQAEAARNTIMFSVIGIIMAIASFAIVSFVVGHI
jgi:hypothetical protein